MLSGTTPAHRRDALAGTLFCFSAAVLFSAKSILIKLAYVHPVDASTVLALRMAFSLPFFLSMAVWSGHSRRQHSRLGRRQWFAVVALGFVGYYLASYLDFLGLQYISASFGWPSLDHSARLRLSGGAAHRGPACGSSIGFGRRHVGDGEIEGDARLVVNARQLGRRPTIA